MLILRDSFLSVAGVHSKASGTMRRLIAAIFAVIGANAAGGGLESSGL